MQLIFHDVAASKRALLPQISGQGLLDLIKIVEVVLEDVLPLEVVHLPVELFPSDA